MRQRLKLASGSPKLHEVYAEGDMTLDQLMAFTVNDDHAREVLWDQLAHSSNKTSTFIKFKLLDDKIEVDGWKWVEALVDLPYGYARTAVRSSARRNRRPRSGKRKFVRSQEAAGS